MQFPVPIPVFSLWASPPKCICYLTCTSTTLAQATTISLLSWIPVASELVLQLCPHSIHSIPIVASACTLWKHRSDHITPLLNPPPQYFPPHSECGRSPCNTSQDACSPHSEFPPQPHPQPCGFLVTPQAYPEMWPISNDYVI